MRGRSERIIGFELDHRPDDNAHRRERLLERMELREQRGLDAGAGLVVRPKPIAKRLDHVVGGDAEVRVDRVRRSLLRGRRSRSFGERSAARRRRRRKGGPCLW